MAINPITPIRPMTSSFVSAIEALKPVSTQNIQAEQEVQQESNGLSFAEMLKNLIDTVNVTSAQTAKDSANLALGLTNDSDLHNIMIDAQKADLAVKTMVSVRNKVMDAYSEIMRINV